MDLKIALDFIEAINNANTDRLYDLMSEDHLFVDSRGNSQVGRDFMKQAWKGYFELFPDYKIEVTDTLGNESMIVLLGYAGGTYNKNSALANCTDELHPSAFVVGMTLVATNFCVSDVYLLWRLKELVRQNKLEAKGELRYMRDFEVKLS